MLIWLFLCTIQLVNGASIVNGIFKATEPRMGEFPFQAALMLRVNNTFFTFCGGSLIHQAWVLTAAHCLEEQDKNLVQVALGSVFTNGNNAQRIRAQTFYINKKYFETGGHDIGLIKLKSSVRLGKNVKLIPLNTNNKDSLIGSTAYLTGFGITDDSHHQPTRLRKAVLHIDLPSKCLMSPSDYPDICCTSSISEGKACKGDSGGPLTILRDGKYVQVGITSHLSILPLCKISFNNSVYTRVSAYIAWISKVTGIDFSKFNQS